MVKPQPSKLVMWVRFPSPAVYFKPCIHKHLPPFSRLLFTAVLLKICLRRHFGVTLFLSCVVDQCIHNRCCFGHVMRVYLTVILHRRRNTAVPHQFLCYVCRKVVGPILAAALSQGVYMLFSGLFFSSDLSFCNSASWPCRYLYYLTNLTNLTFLTVVLADTRILR